MKHKLRSFYRQKLRDRPAASLAIAENLFRLGLFQWIQRRRDAARRDAAHSGGHNSGHSSGGSCAPPATEPALLVAGFQPLMGEPSLLSLYERRCGRGGAGFVFPKVHKKELEFYALPQGKASQKGAKPAGRKASKALKDPKASKVSKAGLASPALSPAPKGRSQKKDQRPGLNAFFCQGAFNILEPNPQFCSKIPSLFVDAFLIPGLAFDRQGRRLGRGGGFYDRLLKQLSSDSSDSPSAAGWFAGAASGPAAASWFDGAAQRRAALPRRLSKKTAARGPQGKPPPARPLKIGISYSAHIHRGDLPSEPHDVRMDALVTENFILIPNMEDSHESLKKA